MRPDCQLWGFNAKVIGSPTMVLLPCSHSCPPMLVPLFGDDGEGCGGWRTALSFQGTSLPTTWCSSVISPSSFRSSLFILGHFSSSAGPLGLLSEMGRGTQVLWPHQHLYSLWSSDNQNRVALLRIFSTSYFTSGRISSLRNATMGSIQLGPTLVWWTRVVFFTTLLAPPRCSTRKIRGSSPTEEVASVANESAWVLPLLVMCDKLNRLKPGRRRLT